MQCPFFSVANIDEAEELLRRLAGRANLDPADADDATSVESKVVGILTEVKKRGLAAVIEYTQEFDSPAFVASNFTASLESLKEAYETLSSANRCILEEAISNIERFHKEQVQRSWFQTRDDGTVLGQRVTPVDRAGLYVPGGKGGTTPLISSLLMNAIPAKVAGVKEIAVVSPPQENGKINPVILASAYMLGINEVYACGGAWGVGALAYGAGPLLPVDVIAGPGNIFVATAKRLLIGTVGIDMIAGPSEVLIIADETANPRWIAADMLSQAEHDKDAAAVCLCTSLEVAEKTYGLLLELCKSLPRSEIAQASLARYGAVIYTPDVDVAIAIANKFAPEHLELLVNNPWEMLPAIRHAGAIFMGHYAAEPLGDYYAGPNHVLPTMGTARFSSALGVETFCKKSSIICASRSFAQKSAEAVARLARLEGLEAHARSALCRKDAK